MIFEYTLTGLKYTLVAGSRVDFPQFAGTQFFAEINFKYDFSPKTILRLSAGKGLELQYFAENQQFCIKQNLRSVIIKTEENIWLKAEIAWNYG